MNIYELKPIMHRHLKYFCLLFFVSLLFGCFGGGTQTKDPVFFRGLPGLSDWVVLPFASENINFDNQFMVQFERILKVQLPSFGISNSALLSNKDRNVLKNYRGNDSKVAHLEFAKDKGFNFAITGEIKNWKTYTDTNKTLELSLTIYNLITLEPIWHINGRKESIDNSDLLPVYRLLLIDLLKLMPVADYK